MEKLVLFLSAGERVRLKSPSRIQGVSGGGTGSRDQKRSVFYLQRVLAILVTEMREIGSQAVITPPEAPIESRMQ